MNNGGNMSFLEELQKETGKTYTDNGAVTNKSSFNHCLDFFALAASMRENPQDAVKLFEKAFFEESMYLKLGERHSSKYRQIF